MTRRGLNTDKLIDLIMKIYGVSYEDAFAAVGLAQIEGRLFDALADYDLRDIACEIWEDYDK